MNRTLAIRGLGRRWVALGAVVVMAAAIIVVLTREKQLPASYPIQGRATLAYYSGGSTELLQALPHGMASINVEDPGAAVVIADLHWTAKNTNPRAPHAIA